MLTMTTTTALALLLALLPVAVAGATHCDDHTPLRRAYFGDTHIHTILSFDAYLMQVAKVDCVRGSKPAPALFHGAQPPYSG